MTQQEKYSLAFNQAEALVENESNLFANLSNICAILNETFQWLWVGFYMVEGDQLVLGPFQGPVACTRINFGKGVCGTSWKIKKTIIVDNVHDFPGHIVCSANSLSEIVIPIIKEGKAEMVLDVDSEREAYFDETDKKNLEELCQLVTKII